MALAREYLGTTPFGYYNDRILSKSGRSSSSMRRQLSSLSLNEELKPSIRINIYIPEENIEDQFALSEHLAPALRTLIELQELEDDWSSYGAKKITSQAIIDTLNILTLLQGSAPAPSVVPTFSGGTQLGWNYGEDVLELVWLEPGKFEYYYEKDGCEEEGIWELRIDKPQVEKYLYEKLPELFQ